MIRTQWSSLAMLLVIAAALLFSVAIGAQTPKSTSGQIPYTGQVCNPGDSCYAAQMPLIVRNPVEKQVKPPVVKQEPIISGSSLLVSATPFTIPEPPIWTHEVKNGAYMMTFTDPQNHWRCFITSVREVNPRNAFGSPASAFTVICYDTSLEENKPNESAPTSSKAAGK